MDVVVAGVGAGGIFTGVSRYIKEVRRKAIVSVPVEAAESPVMSQALAGRSLVPGPHRIQGVGAGFIPENLDLHMIDRVEAARSEEAFERARRLARTEGIMAGISSGAALAAASRLAAEPELANKRIVVIVPDPGERGLSTELFCS